MGITKERWMDEQEGRQHESNLQKIAKYFGLTYQQVEEFEPEIDDVTTNDDMAVAYSVQFPENMPADLVKQIGGHYHQVELGFFGDDEGDEDNYDGESPWVDIDPDVAKGMADQLRKDADENK